MGARTPPRSPSEAPPEALVDWLEFTLPDGADPRDVLPGWGELEWTPMKRGRLGYLSALQCGKVRIDYAGTEGMGYHVTLSGRGCREAEALGLIAGPPAGARGEQLEYIGTREGSKPDQTAERAPDWPAFARAILAAAGHATRVDLALDDRAGRLDLDRMHREFEAGHVSTRWKRIDPRSPSAPGQRARIQTLYLGDPKSEGYGRVYDKAHEQGAGDGERWVRAELQLRRDRADRALHAIAERSSDQIGVFIAGLWRAYIRFVEPTRTRLERCPTAGWWAAFLGEVATVRLGCRPQLSSPEAARACVVRMWGPWMATITRYHGGDVGWFYDALRDGEEHLSPIQRAVLAAAA